MKNGDGSEFRGPATSAGRGSSGADHEAGNSLPSRIIPVRIVTVKATPHRSGGKSSGGRTGPNCDGFLRIATNRLDLPAELISEMYRLRWLVENFFRMFKQFLGCRHLLSTKQNGVEIQVYCGIIACLSIMLYTGRQPTKRTFEMVCFFLSGWASPEELERHIESLPQPV